MKGLFLNTKKANCSIHESGKMCYDCLKLSDKYSLDYQEIHEGAREISSDYDFFIFNYHQVTMGWLDTSYIKTLPGIKFTIVLEVLPDDPFVMCPKGHFNGYIVLDPTLRMNYGNVYSFPRPLEKFDLTFDQISPEIPTIGTFGFATKGKGFEKVIDAVNREFDKAKIRINIPKSDYVATNDFQLYVKKLKEYPTKNDVEIEITHEYYEKEELIKWCGENTINVFLYSRNIPGLSATTDQAIASGKPVAVSTDVTFRHIHQYLTPYPFQTIKDSIKNSTDKIRLIKKEWAPKKFAERFESIIKYLKVNKTVVSKSIIKLPRKNRVGQRTRIFMSEFIPPIVARVIRKIIMKLGSKSSHDMILSTSNATLRPFIHPALQSYSQHGEDLLIDLLLGHKQNGYYLDIGANDPFFNSNTNRFYNKGWNGVNIEPNKIAFEKIQSVRRRDKNVNVAISDTRGELLFYELENDTTVSTLDYSSAVRMSQMLGLPIIERKVKTLTLQDVFNNYIEKPVDFLTVDAEGHDLNVLKGNGWNDFRPSLIIIESNNDFERIREFLESVDYLHIFSNLYNSIFIDKLTKHTGLVEKIAFN